jgi:hypothetical protein
VSSTSDTNNQAGTQRAQLFNYDADNRNVFTSYPARTVTSITSTPPGTATLYDALGRLYQTNTDSELGLLTSTTQYLTGFQKREINPRGYVTTTSFQAFDQPSESAAVTIAAPEGLNVGISRDVFGKPLSIARSGAFGGGSVSATRSYVYDGNQLLCKTVEPEIGATIQNLDGANNVAWRATGLSLTSTSACDTASVPAASKVAYTYDGRNRMTGTGFGDGSPSIGRSYTGDGLPWTIVSNGSTWTYSYNNRRLLKHAGVRTPAVDPLRRTAPPARHRLPASDRSAATQARQRLSLRVVVRREVRMDEALAVDALVHPLRSIQAQAPAPVLDLDHVQPARRDDDQVDFVPPGPGLPWRPRYPLATEDLAEAGAFVTAQSSVQRQFGRAPGPYLPNLDAPRHLAKRKPVVEPFAPLHLTSTLLGNTGQAVGLIGFGFELHFSLPLLTSSLRQT